MLESRIEIGVGTNERIPVYLNIHIARWLTAKS